jgi:DNA-binding MarR family transcriptional regulator
VEDAVKTELMNALQRMRRTNFLSNYKGFDFTMLSLMKSIADNSLNSEDNIFLSELPDGLNITKGAISQIANNLEKNGYLRREIDKSNRRRLIVTITQEGREALRAAEAAFDQLLTESLNMLGEHDTLETIRLFNRFADIAAQMAQAGDMENGLKGES